MIEIYKEEGFLGFPLENCCFCLKGTMYWNQDKDVPVCPACANCRKEWEVPFKEEWASLESKKGNRFSNKN